MFEVGRLDNPGVSGVGGGASREKRPSQEEEEEEEEEEEGTWRKDRVWFGSAGRGR